MKKWHSVLLFLAPFLVFSRLLSAAFVWDDLIVLEQTSQLLKPFSLEGISWGSGGFYRPLAAVSLQFDQILWQMNPFGFHLTNLVLHSLSVLLLFAVLKRFTNNTEIAFFSALLFGVHPAVSETVGWISCRFDLLALLFSLLAMYCLLRYLEEGRKVILLLVIIFSLFSILSKETGILLTLLLPVIYFFYRRESSKSGYVFSLLFIVLMVVFFVSLGDKILSKYGGWHVAIVEGFKLFGFYIYKVFSWNYLTPYSVCLFSDLGDKTFLFSLAMVALSIIFLYLTVKRKSIAGLGILWFLIALLPGIYISLSKGYRLPGADRFLYSALPGLTFLVSLLCFRLLNKKAVPLLIAAALAFVPFSFQRANVWLNAYSLWNDANNKCNGEWTYPLNGLAFAAMTSGRIEEAEVLYEKMVLGLEKGRLKSIFEVENRISLQYGLVDLGRLSEHRRDYQKAEGYFSRADEEYSRFVTQYPKSAKWELAVVNYQIALFNFNKAVRENNGEPLTRALQHVDVSLKYRYTSLETHRLKAYILLRMGECKEAAAFFKSLSNVFPEKDIHDDLLKFQKVCGKN